MPDATERAAERLERALHQLEAAVGRQAERGVAADDLAVEIQMLSVDRARLAERLDQSEGRVARLETVNRDASRRLANAMQSIEAALAGGSPA